METANSVVGWVCEGMEGFCSGGESCVWRGRGKGQCPSTVSAVVSWARVICGYVGFPWRVVVATVGSICLDMEVSAGWGGILCALCIEAPLDKKQCMITVLIL